MSLPASIQKHLLNWALERRRPVCMRVTGDHRLLELWGDPGEFGLESLEIGGDVSGVAPFLCDYALGEEVELPFVTDASGHAYHVHLLPDGENRFVLFIDARQELNERQRHQQTANELKLLLERDRRLIGELIDARTELVILRREAEEESRRRGAFIATMSHEFKTPITAMLAHAERLGEELEPAEIRDTAGAIRRITQQQIWLIDNLLVRARLEADGFAIHRAATDPRALVDDLCLVFAPLAAERELSFAARVEQSVPEFLILDSLHLRQILVNLLSNAIKFTDEGSVELVVEYVEGNLEACVRDTGPGISAEDQAALFQPFQRGREEPRAAGSGLGLSLSRRLADALDGELCIEGGPGGGTQATARVPAEPADLGTVDSADAAGSLIVLGEDDPDITDLLTARLGEAGYRIRGLADGEAVVEAALASDPRLVIVDINMPKLDGPAAARKLREQGFQAPILALSGATDRDDIEYALASGCTEFLRKPPHIPTLKRLIQRLLVAPTAN